MSARRVGEILPGECPRCGKSMEVIGSRTPRWLGKQLGLVSRYFRVVDFIARENKLELEVEARDPKRSFRSLLAALKPTGYLPVMQRADGGIKLTVVKFLKAKPSNVAVNVFLLLLTVLTTFAAGYFFMFGDVCRAALFSFAIMFMLGIHEIGHKVAAWRNGIESTPPYFIPAPTFLGTLGAVINIKSPIPTKEALVELGVSGPLFGFAAAVPLTLLGLILSAPDPEGLAFPVVPAIFALMQIGVFGYVPSGMLLNPLAFAGWVVFLLTMLNLIPAGWLDGGHVSRGMMTRESHYALTRILGFALFFTGFVLPEFPLWFWGFLIVLVFRNYHPGALDDVSELSRRHRILAAATFGIFLLCLPVPVG